MTPTDIFCPDCGLPFAIGQLVKVSTREADVIGYPFTRRSPAVVAGAYPDLDELGVIEPGEGLYPDIYRDDGRPDIGIVVDPGEARHLDCSLTRGRRARNGGQHASP